MNRQAPRKGVAWLVIWSRFLVEPQVLARPKFTPFFVPSPLAILPFRFPIAFKIAAHFKLLVIGCLIPLLAGSSIYVLFRTDSLLMFEWFQGLGIYEPIHQLRGSTTDYASFLPGWMLFAFPNGLWAFSYSFLTLWIWGGRICKVCLFWLLILPLGAILLEAGQAFGMVPGTFDGTDLLFFFIGGTFPLLVNRNFQNLRL